jgi:hypothetical protein
MTTTHELTNQTTKLPGASTANNGLGPTYPHGRGEALSQAAAAQLKEPLAEQPQVALEHRNRIERAKGCW